MATSTRGKGGYDALAVVNWFLDRSAQEPGHPPIDHLKLQKLVYIAHGWNLAINDKPLIFQDVQAWPFGPVVPTVYKAFRGSGYNPIGDRATVVCEDGTRTPVTADFDDKTMGVLNRAWEMYKRYSGLELSGMTHNSDTPWSVVTKGKSKDEYAGTTIGDDDIKRYYVKLAHDGRGKGHAI